MVALEQHLTNEIVSREVSKANSKTENGIRSRGSQDLAKISETDIQQSYSSDKKKSFQKKKPGPEEGDFVLKLHTATEDEVQIIEEDSPKSSEKQQDDPNK